MPRGPSKSPEMPEVLYVISNLGIGGAERHLSLVGRALVGRGHGVCVYSLAGDGPLRGVLEEGGVTVFVPPGSRAGSEGASISRAMRAALAAVHLTYVMLRTRPRIVHFFLPAAYLIGAVAAGLARVKIRVMSRRSLNVYQRGYPMMRWLEMKLHGGMTAILGNSMAVVRQLRDEEGVPGSASNRRVEPVAQAPPWSVSPQAFGDMVEKFRKQRRHVLTQGLGLDVGERREMCRRLAVRDEVVAIGGQQIRVVLVRSGVEGEPWSSCAQDDFGCLIDGHLGSAPLGYNCFIGVGKSRDHRQVEVERRGEVDGVRLQAVDPSLEQLAVIGILPRVHLGEIGVR